MWIWILLAVLVGFYLLFQDRFKPAPVYKAIRETDDKGELVRAGYLFAGQTLSRRRVAMAIAATLIPPFIAFKFMNSEGGIAVLIFVWFPLALIFIFCAFWTKRVQRAVAFTRKGAIDVPHGLDGYGGRQPYIRNYTVDDIERIDLDDLQMVTASTVNLNLVAVMEDGTTHTIVNRPGAECRLIGTQLNKALEDIIDARRLTDPADEH